MFPDMFFELVYSYIVFQHLPRHMVRSYIDDATRVLKPQGQLIFQVQTRTTVQEVDPPDNDFRSIRYYTPNQARALVGAHLTVTETRGDDNSHNYFVHAVKNLP